MLAGACVVHVVGTNMMTLLPAVLGVPLCKLKHTSAPWSRSQALCSDFLAILNLGPRREGGRKRKEGGGSHTMQLFANHTQSDTKVTVLLMAPVDTSELYKHFICYSVQYCSECGLCFSPGS